MKRSVNRIGAVLSLVTFTFAALAFEEPQRPQLSNFDKRLPRADKAPGANDEPAARARLESRVPGVKIERDPVLGSPKLVSSTRGFLTGPDGEGRGVTPEAARALPKTDPHRATRAFLNEHSPLFGHDAGVLADARIRREFITPHNGLRTTVWEQQLDGIPVFEAVLISHVTKRGELVSVGSQFVPDLRAAANRGNAARATLRQDPDINAPQALALALKNIGEVQDAAGVSIVAEPVGTEKKQQLRAAGVRQEADTRLLWLPMDRVTLRLCWELVFTSKARGEMFRVMVDAQSGEVLVRHCLTEYISNASYRVYTKESPTPFSPGYPTRTTNQPPLGARELVVTNAFNTNASPNGWIDDGVNETRGNNVDAHLDRDDNNSPDLPRPQGAPFRVFDFPINFNTSPTNYASAAVVQLFYYCNLMHDRLYELGFTEAAGNFQVNNFGRGGAGNDPVQADAQDGGGFNNANFSTPPDGSSGRMQMYLWDGPEPDRDGDFDGEVVLHEYAHGLSNRRVGGGVGISALQSRGMGEGWSDFYGMAMFADAGEDIHGSWARGGYSRFLAGGGFLENYYFGGRRYPYSTDMTKNPLTFKDIDPTQADPHLDVPRSPIVANTADQVHNQGNVWCVTLWEVRANLITKHGFTSGNELALKLVTDGMNFSPPNPNFLQARDGIIQADNVLTAGSNANELWRAFAKRGMGASATSPASSTTVGVRESYDLPDDLRIAPLTDLTTRGNVAGPFIPTAWTLTLNNVGDTPLGWTAQSGGLAQLSLAEGNLAAGGSANVTVQLSSAAANLPAGTYQDTLIFSNTVTGVQQNRRVTVQVGGTDYFTELFDSTGALDLDFQSVLFTPDGSTAFYNACRNATSAFPVDPAGGTTLVLTDDTFLQVTLGGGAQVSLYGRRTNVFFVGSNGYLTLGSGDSDLDGSFLNHFRLPRISALYDDLNPGSAGTVSWRQLADRVAVTFSAVPRFGFVDTNNFQFELFFDGRIRITWLRVDATSGLAGLSAGLGVPADFQESDLSVYGLCLPALTLRAPARVNEGDGILAIGGEVRIPAAFAANISVTLVSSDPTQVSVPPNVSVAAGATNAFFPITLLDDALLNGTRQVRLTASAASYRSGSAVIVLDDNESATLSVVLPESAREGDGLLRGAGLVQVETPPDRSVIVQVNSLSPGEVTVPLPRIAILNAGQTIASFDFAVVDDTRIDGKQVATISASVPNWAGGGGAISIFDNEVAALALVLPAQVSEGNGVLTNAARVRASGTVARDLMITLGSLSPAEVQVPASVIIRSNTTETMFNLTVVDDSAVDGLQTAHLFATAPDFLGTTNSLNVADNESPEPPFRPSPQHQSSNVTLNVTLSWFSGEGEQWVNGDFETGDFTGWTRENLGSGDFVVSAGTFNPESPDDSLPPYAGSFSALSQQQGAGHHALYQDVFIPAGATFATLSWAQRLRNFASDFGPGQEFRVEIRNNANGVRNIPFVTQPGDQRLGAWIERSLDLGGYRGETIRVAFVAEDARDYFNAHLDEVSLTIGAALPTTFDVYFGTSPAPGPGQLLGNTTNTSWELPSLAQFTTYYWQVVARRGPLSVSGPVWQFRTRANPSRAVLINAGSVWNFRDTGDNLGTTWNRTNFNDSAWASGPARLGYGGDGEVTPVSFGGDPLNRHITTYFRRSFLVTNAAAFVALNGRLVRDDGAVVYLNGSEVFRSNLPLSPAVITNRTLASTPVDPPFETNLFAFSAPPGLLHEGTNVVAVEVHQDSPVSPDLGFDLELAGTRITGPNLLPIVAITNPPSSYMTVFSPTNLQIGVDASDADGSVAKVEFFINEVKLTEDLTAPFATGWAGAQPGTHALRAVAIDNEGASNSSPVVHLVVNRSGVLPFTLVRSNALWRYLDNGSDQGIDWRGTNFNDDGWLEGPAELGYGDGDEATIVDYGPNIELKYITTYFRHTFTNDAVFNNVTVNLVRDDGAVVYLNEVEISRSNMPPTNNYLTLALTTVNVPDESRFFSTVVSPSLVRRGRNVLAVEIHQRDAFSSDLSFNLSLTGNGNIPPTVALVTPTNNATLLASSGVAVQAVASDRYGRVARVDFFAGTNMLGSDVAEPFTLDWQPAPGSYTLSALARDQTGGTNRSEVVTVTVVAAPLLNASRSQNLLRLSWPVDESLVLETAFDLAEPIEWLPLTNTPSLIEGLMTLDLQTVGTNQFFRLTRP